MKKILKIVASIIFILITVIIYISYTTDSNQQVLLNLTEKIKNNYNTNENINYSNEYGAYYIIKTDTKVIVLSKDYQEVVKEDISKLKETLPETNLIYKTNKLMYEKTIRKQKKVTYEYYDAKKGEKVKSTTLELK